MKKILMVLVLIALLLVPVVLVAVQVQGQDDYFVLMLVCGGTYDSSDLHVGRFDSEADAKAWADAEMSGVWDFAYIYDSWTYDGSMKLLWLRSEGDCYSDMRSCGS